MTSISLTPTNTLHKAPNVPFACPVIEQYKPTSLHISPLRADGTIGVVAHWELGRANAPGCSEIHMDMTIPVSLEVIEPRRIPMTEVTSIDPIFDEAKSAKLTVSMVHGLLAGLESLYGEQGSLVPNVPKIEVDTRELLTSIYSQACFHSDVRDFANPIASPVDIGRKRSSVIVR